MEEGGGVGAEEEVSKEPAHKCQYCSKHYSSSHSLRTHEKWHRGDLGHPCTHCSKKFRNPSEVRRHEMTHTGEKPHPCPQCKMKFIQKASLREHLEKKHPEVSTPEGPPLLTLTPTILLSCKYCQRQFTDQAALAQHEAEELREFELLHQTFEQVELQEIPGLQDYLAPPSALPDLQVKTETVALPLYPANNNSQGKAEVKDQEEEEVISQFFEELEGAYPHLRGELGKVLSDTDSSSSLSSSSPRHSATPVDTIPASNLSNPTYMPPAPSETVPVIHITPLPNHLTPLPNQLTSTLAANLTYQDELNSFCEGILSQLGTSAWAEELNLGPDLGDLPEPAPSQEVVYRGGLPQGQGCSEWTEGASHLPPGWQTRLLHVMVGTRQVKRAEFLSPTGQHFPSRKTAVDHMVRTEVYSTEDLDTMRRGLRTKTQFEWESGRPGVPEGWMTREKLSSDGKVRVFYLSPGGISFPCRQAALEHMSSDGTYSPADVDMMRVGAGAKRSRGQGEFLAGDSSLPAGWRVRLGPTGRETFRCPQGVFHPSRAAVLDTLVKRGAATAEVELVRASLAPKRRRRKRRVAEEEWVVGDPSLPAGWKIRLVDCSDGHAVTFLQTPQGVKLKGRKAGLAHVLQHPGLFSQEAVDLMKASLNIVSKVTEAWEDNDPSLPPGWRIKRYKSKTESRRVHCEFLSPDMRVFRSRRAVADHLREQGAAADTIKRLEAGSSFRPTTPVPAPATTVPASVLPVHTDPAPPAFTSTEVTPAAPTVPETTPALSPPPAPLGSPVATSPEYVPSADSVAVPATTVGVTRSTILPPCHAPAPQGLAPGRPVVLQAKEPKAAAGGPGRGSEVPWRACSSLPQGWKTRTVFWSDREKTLYLSPTGRSLTSRKAVVAAMVAMGGYSQADLDKVAGKKRRRKTSNHWVPTRRKTRRKGLVKAVGEEEGLAERFVGYFDGEDRGNLRPCNVNLEAVEVGEEEVRRARDSLADTSQLKPPSEAPACEATNHQQDVQ